MDGDKLRDSTLQKCLV